LLRHNNKISINNEISGNSKRAKKCEAAVEVLNAPTRVCFPKLKKAKAQKTQAVLKILKGI
jgi:hypothetical protein